MRPTPWDLIAGFGVLGVVVQSGGGSPDGFGFVPHEDALIVADAIRALETSARFEDRIEATALFGDLAAIAGDAIESIMKASFDPRSIVISKDMAHPQE